MQQPLAGELSFDFRWFQTVDASELRVLMHTPRSHSGTAEKIERLLRCEAKLNRETNWNGGELPAISLAGE